MYAPFAARALAVLLLFLTLAGSGLGCATSLKSQLDWYRADRERLIGDMNRLESELSTCQGEQDGLKDSMVLLRQRLERAQNEAQELRNASLRPEDSGLTPALEAAAADAFRDIEGVSTGRGDHGEFVVTMDQAILFPSGSAAVSAAGTKTLERLAAILKRDFAGREIRVEGHTDNVPPKRVKDRYPSNWELSAARAAAVLRSLLASGAAEPGRCSLAGHADQKPVAGNGSEEGRRKNRRVEIMILP